MNRTGKGRKAALAAGVLSGLLGSCQPRWAAAPLGPALRRQLVTAAPASPAGQGPGLYLLLHFGPAACAACHAAGGPLPRLYQQFHSRGLVVVSVGGEADQPTDTLQWPLVPNRAGRASLRQQYSLPAPDASLLLDPSGRELARNLHGRALGQKISEYLPLD